MSVNMDAVNEVLSASGLLRATGPRAPFVKHDQGKARLDLVPPLALLAVGRVLAHGAAKYGAGNWRKCPPDEALGRYVAAAMRHLLALLAGEDVDPETGESHAAHAACCALFLTELRGGGA